MVRVAATDGVVTEVAVRGDTVAWIQSHDTMHSIVVTRLPR